MAIYDVFELQPTQIQDPTFQLPRRLESINASGVAEGSVFQQLIGFWGTIWPSAANPQSISSPTSYIFDINDNGDAVGNFGLDNTATAHAFLLSGGSLIDLVPTLPLGAFVRGINNQGLVVGGTLDGRGIIYDSAQPIKPVIFIDAFPGQRSSEAWAVNASGAVAGISGDNLGHGFLYVERWKRRALN